MPKRLSTRLIVNAGTTYLRLATTFVLGIFLTWFLIGRIGLEIFGLVSLAVGTFGFSQAIHHAIMGSLNREFAAAIASGDPELVSRTHTNALLVTLQGALIVVGLSAVFAALAWIGVFRVPEGHAWMHEALAVLFISDGVAVAIRLFLAPYRQALFGDRRVGLDNIFMVVNRVMYVASAVVVLGLAMPGAPMWARLMIYAAVLAVTSLADTAMAVALARRHIRGLRFNRAFIDRGMQREIRISCLQSGQHLILIDYGASFIGVLINLFFGVAYNGMWQIAIQIFGHGRLLAEGLLRGIDPIVTHLREGGRDAMIQQLMIRSIRYQLAIALPWTVLYVVFMEPILMLWVGRRLEKSHDLVEAAISVESAVATIGLLGTLCLGAMLFRVATRGVERSLYGMGFVSSYAWAAKYALAFTVASAALAFALGAPVWVSALAFMVIHVLYYDVIVLRAAHRVIGFPAGRAMARSVPPPVIASAILAVVLVLLRPVWPPLTLSWLLALLAVVGAVYAPLLVLVVAERDERRRVFDIGMRIIRRALVRRAPAP